MKKLYEVVIGYRNIKDGSESYNCDSYTVISEDAVEVLAGRGGEYLIKKEVELKKENIFPFVEQIKMISVINFI